MPEALTRSTPIATSLRSTRTASGPKRRAFGFRTSRWASKRGVAVGRPTVRARERRPEEAEAAGPLGPVPAWRRALAQERRPEEAQAADPLGPLPAWGRALAPKRRW